MQQPDIPALSGAGILPFEPDSEARILLVEDDAVISEMYRVKLEMDGHRVVVAADGETGIALAGAHPTTIILLDVGLPDMDGLAVLEVLRADDRTRRIPVMMLSNYDETSLAERACGLGAIDYLVKAETTPSMLARFLRDWIKPAPLSSDLFPDPEAAASAERPLVMEA